MQTPPVPPGPTDPRLPPAGAYPSTPQLPAPPATTDSMAIWALVLGIIGVVPCCSLAGPIAFFLGQSSRNRIRSSGGTLAGEGMATAGWIMGIAGSIVLALVIFWFIWTFVLQITTPQVH